MEVIHLEVYKIIAATVSSSAAAAGLIFNAIQMSRATKQRKADLRWKKAEAGVKMVADMLHHTHAFSATKMLDNERIRYKSQFITRKDIEIALCIENLVENDICNYIRDCFDALFYYWMQIQYSIDIGLVEKSDIEYPISYYVKRISEHNQYLYIRYMEKYEFNRAIKLMKSMPA